MNKQPEITAATRKRILEAFWTLFHTTPVEKITAGHLAEEAGIHRSSFYRYYPDIYLVLDDFQKDMLSRIKSESIDHFDYENLTVNRLTEYIQNTSKILEGNADKIYRLLNCSASGFHQALMEELRHQLGRFPFDQQLDLEYLTTTLSTIMVSNFKYWYERKNSYALQDVNLMAFRMFGSSLMKLLTMPSCTGLQV